jgi:hypothetical protein
MMKRTAFALPLLAILLLLVGCAGTRPTLAETYPRMYQEPPASILILPPINLSTAADAKEYFSCSLSEAVGLRGYYVMPVEAVFTILREEGFYDTENVTPTVLANIRKHFGADAVLISTIKKWDKSWFLTSGTLRISADFALLSTATAETLWDFSCDTEVELGSDSDNILGAIIESAIKTAIEDYFPNALKSNVYAFRKGLPNGKYHPGFGLDGEDPASKHGEYKISK